MQPAPGRAPRCSVIVVSRHRPQHLARCLAALARQTHPEYEIVLVADPASVGICADLPLKRRAFDIPNISLARNEGIALAAAPVVAFIDDDAIALPGWAEALTRPFADPRVLAGTGFTRGPDGLSWQARAERMTASGQAIPFDLDEPALLAPEDGCPISTIGTNCAFRRETLLEIGGFDGAFPYHLDESDVNMRLCARFPQGLTAVVPQAQVIHGIAPGSGRAGAGVPQDLTQIGRSSAIFAARHGGDARWVQISQRRRLLRHMVAGRLDPFAVAPLMATLRAGLAEGRALCPPPPVGKPAVASDFASDFRPISGHAPRHVFLAGWHWRAGSLRESAARAVAAGDLATILLMTPSVLPHRMVMGEGGWWEQRGGLWGPSRPGDSPVFLMGWHNRCARERGNSLDLGVKSAETGNG
ncbi:glycosyltransferase family 2 protein [Paracoccus lutimaris]|uniref:GT2 family glycosyltransferase n=1 Tax=Paracoccus lutimaris TaxID=1490030 RepID=A0A368YND1_9RHOB|nr:glycosyltransferase family 2 protein [Paracoccus lutimaris]RCW81731.1 GT2 family glycosyltransferase [Paracoccus lutimaris]